jgi:hypothetical protein
MLKELFAGAAIAALIVSSAGAVDRQFRIAGVPTWAASSLFLKDGDVNAHDLNERVPVDIFFAGLDHWSTIIEELAGTPASEAASAE